MRRWPICRVAVLTSSRSRFSTGCSVLLRKHGAFPFRSIMLQGRGGAAPPVLDHIQFPERPPLRDALIPERRAIDRAIAAMHDELRQRLADRRRLLQAMAGKAVGEEEVVDLRMRPDHRVLVERVVVVMAGPRARRLNGFEGGVASAGQIISSNSGQSGSKSLGSAGPSPFSGSAPPVM